MIFNATDQENVCLGNYFKQRTGSASMFFIRKSVLKDQSHQNMSWAEQEKNTYVSCMVPLLQDPAVFKLLEDAMNTGFLS